MNKKTEKYVPEKYWEDRLRQDFSLGGVGYLGMGEEYNKWLYKARERALNKMIEKNKIFPEGKKLLDIGVGNGFYISYWKKGDISKIVGIDITSKSIEELSKKYPEFKFIKEDISFKDFSLTDQFDIITAFDVLFHIVDEDRFEQAIRNIAKLSYKGSKILISDNFLKDKAITGGPYE